MHRGGKAPREAFKGRKKTGAADAAPVSPDTGNFSPAYLRIQVISFDTRYPARLSAWIAFLKV